MYIEESGNIVLIVVAKANFINLIACQRNFVGAVCNNPFDVCTQHRWNLLTGGRNVGVSCVIVTEICGPSKCQKLTRCKRLKQETQLQRGIALTWFLHVGKWKNSCRLTSMNNNITLKI
jgi:hypothetical protein